MTTRAIRAVDPRLVATGLLFLAVAAWRFSATGAVALLLIVLIHEVGHGLALVALGKPWPRILFIPLLGGVAIPQDAADTSPETLAWVALGGPLVGGVVAVLCGVGHAVFGGKLLFALAVGGFVINLVNLVPLLPLDGGKVTAMVDRRLWWLGLVLGVGLLFRSSSPVGIAVAILAVAVSSSGCCLGTAPAPPARACPGPARSGS